MTREQFKAQVGEWLLGALSHDEAQDMQSFVASTQFDADCERAMAEASDAIALLGASLPPVAPSAQSWDRIALATGPARRIAWRGWAVAAVACGLLVVSETQRREQEATLARTLAVEKDACTVILQRAEQAEKSLREQREAMDILHHNATQLVRLDAKSKSAPEHVRAIFNPVAKRAWIVAPSLAAPADKDYELWVVHGKDVRPAGLLRGDVSGVLIANVDPKLLETVPDAFVITLEPHGGVPASVGETLLVGAPSKT